MSDFRISDRIAVHDGDTPVVDGERLRMRLGDAPEVADPRKFQPDAVGAQESKEALARALVDGYEIETAGEDRYGRPLFDAHKEGSPTLSNEMLANGLTMPPHWKTIEGDDGGAAMVRDGADMLMGVDREENHFKVLGDKARRQRLDDLMTKIQSGALTSQIFAVGDNTDPRDDKDYGTFGPAFERGVDNMQSTFYGFADALGSAAGIDVLSEWGQDGVAANVVEAMRNPARVESWEDIDGFADTMTYALEAVGEFSPQLLTDVAAGFATGGTAVLGKEALAMGGKALLRRAGTQAVAAPRKVAVAGWQAFEPAAKAGAFLSAYMQNAGETQNQFQAEGIDAPGQALAIGVGKAALDYAGLDATLRQAFKGLGKEATSDPFKLTQWLGRSAAAASVAFSAESVTEGAQTLMDELAIQGHKPDHEVNWSHVVDAMLKGGIGGGVAGGGGYAVGGLLGGRTAGADETGGLLGGRTAGADETGGLLGGRTAGADETGGTDTADPLAAQAAQMGADNTTPTPESVQELVAQVVHPGKPVTYIPPANSGDASTVLEQAAAQGAAVHTLQLANGGLLVANDPSALEGVSTDPSSAELAQLLGMDRDRAEIAATTSAEQMQAVEVIDADGNTLHAEVTAPEDAERVAAKLRQQYPTEQVTVTTPTQVVERRAQRRTLGSAVPKVNLDAPAVEDVPSAELVDDPAPLTIKQVQQLSDDELRARLEYHGVEAIDLPAETTSELDARAVAGGVVDRLSGNTKNVTAARVLHRLLGRGELGRVQASTVGDLLNEANSEAGRTKILSALQDPEALAQVAEELKLQGKGYRKQVQAAPKLDRVAATRALLGAQAAKRTPESAPRVDTPVVPRPDGFAKNVGKAQAAAKAEKASGEAARRDRATAAGKNAPLGREEAAVEQGDTQKLRNDEAKTESKRDKEWGFDADNRFYAAVDSAVTQADIEAHPEFATKPLTAALEVQTERRAIADGKVESEYGGDRVAYLVGEHGMSRESALATMGESAPAESKVTATEEIAGEAPKQREVRHWEETAPVSDTRAKTDVLMLSPEATKRVAKVLERLRVNLENTVTAGLSVFHRLYPRAHMQQDDRAEVGAEFNRMLEDLGLATRDGKGVQGLALALLHAARDTHQGELEVASEFTKIEPGAVASSTATITEDDGQEYAREDVVAEDKRLSIDQALTLERLAERLLRGEPNEKAHRKLVATALRSLFPASEFGLRRLSVKEIERAGGDPAEGAVYTTANAPLSSAVLQHRDAPEQATRLFRDLVLERLLGRMTAGYDVLGDPKAELDAVSSEQTVKLRGDATKHAAALESVDPAMVDGYFTLLWFDLAAQLRTDPEALSFEELRDGLLDPASREAALAVMAQKLANMPSPADMQERMAQLPPVSTGAPQANAKGVSRGQPFKGDELLSNSVFGYFVNRVLAWVDGISGLGKGFKRAEGQPRVFDTHTVVALDAETLYDEQGFSLRGMGADSYVNDPRFQVHLWTVRRPGDAEATVLRTPGEVKAYIEAVRAEAAASGKPLLLAAHNAPFDARVLSHTYGIDMQGDERFVDTVSLFRAAQPQAGVTKKDKRPSHRLEVLADHLREQGVEGVAAKDKDANVAMAGKRMPWNEGTLEAASDEEVAAFEDYAKNDTSVVLAALDHFDPSPAFVDLSHAEVAQRRGLPGSAELLMGALQKHGVVPAVRFARRNESSRRFTEGSGARNLLPVTMTRDGHSSEVLVDMVALAQYSQSGEQRPSTVLEAYENLQENLRRMMAADAESQVTDSGVMGVPHIAVELLPDDLVIHFAEGKPRTVADARRAEAARLRANATRAGESRTREQAQLHLAVLDQAIEQLLEVRRANEIAQEHPSSAVISALDIIERRMDDRTFKGGVLDKALRDAGEAVERAYNSLLNASMDEAKNVRPGLVQMGLVDKNEVVTLRELIQKRGEVLGELKANKNANIAAEDIATVSRVEKEVDADDLLQAARAKEDYVEADERMRRGATLDAERAWGEQGSEGATEGRSTYEPHPEVLRVEDLIRSEGEQQAREQMAEPAAVPGYTTPTPVEADAPVAASPLQIGAKTSRAKGQTDFQQVSTAEQRSIDRMLSTLNSFGGKSKEAVRGLLTRLAAQGVPVGGVTLVPIHTKGMVDGGAERLLDSLGIPATVELIAAVRDGGSFYVMTPSGPVIGLANHGESPKARAAILSDLAHELGHMLRDRLWSEMDAETRAALARDFAADHQEDMTTEERREAEHEWFANRMTGAILGSLREATRDVSHPVAVFMSKMLEMAFTVWRALNMTLRQSQAFDAFAQDLFGGKFRSVTRTPRSAESQVYHADGYERVRQQAAAKLQMASTQARSMFNKGIMPALRSMLANVATRIGHYDPLLARQLFQGANTDSTGKRAFEQNYRAIRSRMRGAIEKVMLGFENEEAFRAAFDDLIQGRDTEGAKTAGKLITDLQGAAKEAGLKSVLYRAGEPPLVFDREAVERNRAGFERMLAGAGFTQNEVRTIVAGILEGEQAIELSIAPGIPVGDHSSTHLLAQRLGRARLQTEGWLLDRHAEALLHWADSAAKRAAWDTAFGAYLDVGGHSGAARMYFGTQKPTQDQVEMLRSAGLIDDMGRLFHTNHKFVQRLDLIEKVHGGAARLEVLSLTLGALGKHPAGQRMPGWFRHSQDFVLSWVGKTMLMYSGLMSLPEPAVAVARAGGRVSLSDAFTGYRQAKRFAEDMGIVLKDATEYMAFQGEQYQAPLMRKVDHWFFKLNGNQLVTNTARVLATSVAIRYLHAAVDSGDHAALARLNVTAEQIKVWEAKGRPAWSMALDPDTRGLAAAVGDAINQFVQEGSLQPSRFQATHWGNNPYMRALWQLKHFLYTSGSTLVAGVYRDMSRRFKGGQGVAAVAPLAAFALLAMPLALAAGEARDWIRRLLDGKSEFSHENPATDRALAAVRRTGVLGPAEMGLSVWRQYEWGNGPLAALSPAFSLGQRVYSKVLPGETPQGDPKPADYSEAMRLIIPMMSQNKGLWEMVTE